MNDKKIIIRNCPAFLDDVQLLEFSEGTCNSLQNHRTYCQDCTDCLLKQIVELCGKYHVIDAGYQKVAINYLSSDILKHLDIQEVE